MPAWHGHLGQPQPCPGDAGAPMPGLLHGDVIRTPRQSPRGSAAQAHVWDQQSFPGPGQPPVGSPQPPEDSWPQGTSQSSRAGRAQPGPGHKPVCPLEPRCARSTMTTTRSGVRSWESTVHSAQVRLQHSPWCPEALGSCLQQLEAGWCCERSRSQLHPCRHRNTPTFHSLGKQQS